MNIKRHFLVYKGLPKDIYILFISSVINRMGSFIMPLLTLILTLKLGFSKSEAGSFATISMASQAPFLMLGGKLADKIGSKKIIVFFDFAGALVYFICGFLKPSFAVAILIVVASDLYAIASPAFNSIVAEVTPAASLKSAFSLMYLGFNLGLTVGPALGGILFNSHLNLLFILDGLTTLLATALILFKVRGKKKGDIPSQQIKGQNTEKSGSRSIFYFLYCNPFLVIFSAILLIYNFCYIQWTFLLPLQMADIFKIKGSGLYSLLVSMNAITVIVLTPLLTSVTQKVHPIKSIVIGGAFYFLSFAMFSINQFAAIFITGIIIMTVGEILISINKNSYIAQHTPKTHLSRANSLLFIVDGTGYALGPVVIGNLLMSINIQKAWLIVLSLMMCGTFAMYVLKRFDKKEIQTENESTQSIIR